MSARISRVILSLFLVSGSLYAQAPKENNLVGTWKVTTIALPNQPRIASPQPGLYIFTPKYYSIIRINSDKPGPVYATRQEAKDQDILAIYDALTAQAGTYTVSGNHLRTRPLTAKNPSVITGPEDEYEFDISGRNLLIRSLPADRSAATVIALTRLEY